MPAHLQDGGPGTPARPSSRTSMTLDRTWGCPAPLPLLSPRVGLSVILLSMIFKSSPLFSPIEVSSKTHRDETPPQATPTPGLAPASPYRAGGLGHAVPIRAGEEPRSQGWPVSGPQAWTPPTRGPPAPPWVRHLAADKGDQGGDSEGALGRGPTLAGPVSGPDPEGGSPKLPRWPGRWTLAPGRRADRGTWDGAAGQGGDPQAAEAGLRSGAKHQQATGASGPGL